MGVTAGQLIGALAALRDDCIPTTIAVNDQVVHLVAGGRGVERMARAAFEEAARQNPDLHCEDGFGFEQADNRLTILDGAYDLSAIVRAVLRALEKADAGTHPEQTL